MRAAPAFVRCCRIFFSVEHERALVAAMFNHAGLYAERAGEVATGPLRDPEVLGQLVRAALARCEFQPEFNYRDRKRTDWPSFQESGCRSIRAFEATYDGLLIEGANEANLDWKVSSQPLGRFDIHLTAHVSGAATDRELGDCLLYVWDSYRETRHRPLADSGT